MITRDRLWMYLTDYFAVISEQMHSQIRKSLWRLFCVSVWKFLKNKRSLVLKISSQILNVLKDESQVFFLNVSFFD